MCDWISLYERLPPTDTTVFVADEATKEVSMFAWSSHHESTWSDIRNGLRTKWTHWMPLTIPAAPGLPKTFSPREFKQGIAALNLGFENERLKQRIAYLTSVKDASRLDRMRLAEENLWLRELAGIAPGADIPKPPTNWHPEEK
jgi:hypothetical protein